MNREEAIRIIETVFQDEYVYKYYDSITHQALDMAIEALSVANLKGNFESAEYEDYEHATLVDIKEPLKVAVVRCKDCRHANKSMLCSVYLQPRLPSDFCNYGERREPGK